MDKYIDKTLTLSNAAGLLRYINGGKGMATSTASSFEGEALSGAFDRLTDAVEEHNAWLDTNCDAQRTYYCAFVKRHSGRTTPVKNADSNSGNGSAAQAPDRLGPTLVGVAPAEPGSGRTSPQIAAASGQAVMETFDVAATLAAVDEDLREAVMGTASAALGAPTVGLLVTSWLDNAVEDLVVVAVAAAASYASVINLPLRRSEIKAKIRTRVTDFVASVQERMQQQLARQLAASVSEIEVMVDPLERAATAEVVRLEAQEAIRSGLAAQVAALQLRVFDLK